MADQINVQTSGDVSAAMDSVVSQMMNRANRLDFRWVIRNTVLRRLRIWHEYYFINDKDPEGKPWKKLHPITIKRKGHGRILEETEALLQSLVGINKHSIAQVRYSEGKIELRYGTRRPDAWRHQTGTGRPGQNLPQRKMVGINTLRVNKLVEHVADDAVVQIIVGQRAHRAAATAAAAGVIRRSA